ncbi:hypothetical protein PENTCL1PPCAC_15083, partial [Pristionchus entomophagus]
FFSLMSSCQPLHVGIIAIIVLSLYLFFSFPGARSEIPVVPVIAVAVPILKYIVEPTSQCNEHHIVLVLGRYKSINLASTLFKSILYHHRGPLVFHLITDEESRQVLHTLFETWKLPSVRYQIYDMDRYKKHVDWIYNSHYSSFYGLIKVIIPEILSDDVKEVLMLDSDTVVLQDITPLFHTFKETNESVLFAMGENISPWYEQQKLWTYRGRGFNSGVVFLHLERMRSANWSEIWNPITKKILASYKDAADQDIFNALIVTQPEVFIELPCEYNFQLGVSAQPLTCKIEDRDVKIAHFNSDVKMNLANKFVVHFARAYAVYQAMDGYVFRQRERCETDNSSSTLLTELSETDSDCSDLLSAIQTTYRTHLHFNGAMQPANGDAITLVTQFTVDRFEDFKKLLELWAGPVSAAIYCTDAELTQIEKFMQASNIGRGRKNVALHAVFKTGNYYPINYLRNVALNASTTDLSYLTYVDFIPSKGIYRDLLSCVKNGINNTALVVPSFEMSPSEVVQMPRTKEELNRQWEKGKVRNDHIKGGCSIFYIFHQIFPAGNSYNGTDYDKWKNFESQFEIQWNYSHESFVVTTRQIDRLYDERLVGYGWSNVAQLQSLHAEGYRFKMAPSIFTVHHAHKPPFDITRFYGFEIFKKCMHIFDRDQNFKSLIQQAVACS